MFNLNEHLQIFNGLSLRSSNADLIVFLIDCVSVDVFCQFCQYLSGLSGSPTRVVSLYVHCVAAGYQVIMLVSMCDFSRT
jgi:hypothetical protein